MGDVCCKCRRDLWIFAHEGAHICGLCGAKYCDDCHEIRSTLTLKLEMGHTAVKYSETRLQVCDRCAEKYALEGLAKMVHKPNFDGLVIPGDHTVLCGEHHSDPKDVSVS